ncbi:MAG: hypothetical protein ACE5HE_12330 [Phycisphaerae bacterium]
MSEITRDTQTAGKSRKTFAPGGAGGGGGITGPSTTTATRLAIWDDATGTALEQAKASFTNIIITLSISDGATAGNPSIKFDGLNNDATIVWLDVSNVFTNADNWRQTGAAEFQFRDANSRIYSDGSNSMIWEVGATTGSLTLGSGTGGDTEFGRNDTTLTYIQPKEDAYVSIGRSTKLFSDLWLNDGIHIKEGTNKTMGAATLTAGSVTVSTTKVTASSRIFLTGQNSSGTAGFLRVSSRSAGTSFTITSSSGSDTRSVAWLLLEPA